METNNFYTKMATIINSLEKTTNNMLTEIMYLKMHNTCKNEQELWKNTGMLMLKLSDVTKDVTRLLSVNVDMLKELKLPHNDLKNVKKQIDESNQHIIQLSNGITNLAYFITQNYR